MEVFPLRNTPYPWVTRNDSKGEKQIPAKKPDRIPATSKKKGADWEL